MVLRLQPESYFAQPQAEQPQTAQQPYVYQPMQTETVQIPPWVPWLLGIALVGAFAVALYAIHRRC